MTNCLTRIIELSEYEIRIVDLYLYGRSADSEVFSVCL